MHFPYNCANIFLLSLQGILAVSFGTRAYACRRPAFVIADQVPEKEVNMMKEGIHPNYTQTTIRCACGEVIETGSTKQNLHVEICSKCHPFYTGKQKLVDTGGRVDRFKKKFGIDK